MVERFSSMMKCTEDRKIPSTKSMKTVTNVSFNISGRQLQPEIRSFYRSSERNVERRLRRRRRTDVNRCSTSVRKSGRFRQRRMVYKHNSDKLVSVQFFFNNVVIFA